MPDFLIHNTERTGYPSTRLRVKEKSTLYSRVVLGRYPAPSDPGRPHMGCLRLTPLWNKVKLKLRYRELGLRKRWWRKQPIEQMYY